MEVLPSAITPTRSVICRAPVLYRAIPGLGEAEIGVCFRRGSHQHSSYGEKMVAIEDGLTAGHGDLWRVRRIKLGEADYPYHYGYDCLDQIICELSDLAADRLIVVTDDTVLSLHGDAVLAGLRALAPVEVLSHRPGEALKSLPQLADYAERALTAGVTRRSVVIAFGGGVPGNLGGLLAALLFRGVRLVHIPTTTIAAMDSVLSLKQAINSSCGKNHIGTYYAPAAVFTDVRLLQTLPVPEFQSGLCEAAKNCLAIQPRGLSGLRELIASASWSSPASLLWLLDESIQAKTTVTACDSREQRGGLVLEYGHTVGHALELAVSRRPGPGMAHGQCVAFGMVVAAHIAHQRGWLSSAEVELHEELAGALRAPLRLPPGLSADEIVALVRADNKRGYLPPDPQSVPFVLLRGLGQPAGDPDLPLVPVRLDEVSAALTASQAVRV
jgi:3-dehydroquinate synthase/2-deoxy-scyllo-inosose synthase